MSIEKVDARLRINIAGLNFKKTGDVHKCSTWQTYISHEGIVRFNGNFYCYLFLKFF
uniref:Uncharacterized protein n=1 Tax=Onchocerca volvulus TaxID=6282 RepID=A0A8R1TWH3_ONCVO